MGAAFRLLFWATIKQGVVEYHSCRTGYSYLITPEDDGFTVESQGANLTIWTPERKDALHLIETSDLASLAKKEGGECSLSTG